MRDFFHGWRRKTGVATLMMALAFLVGWIRSETYSDAFSFSCGTNMSYTIYSVNGYLFFELMTMPVALSNHTHFRTLYSCDPNECYLYYRDQTIGWRFLCFAVGVDEVVPDNSDTEGPHSLFVARRTWFMSYWTMISSLAILAAYLILVPIRKRPPSMSQPHA